ncbi:MAG: CotH kinase family protein [Kiritimatiellae bacterium]|nr:CotH kinase family protein [Kiritimatiellia bacterium]
MKKLSSFLLLLVLVVLAFPFLVSATIVINEVQSSNDSTCRDEYGLSSDWVELYNTGSTNVDLSGWGVSDKTSKPFKWVFPVGATIAAQSHLRLFASGRDSVEEQELEESDPSTFSSNLVLWLRADDFASSANGTSVTNWIDRSDYGNHVTQCLARAPSVQLQAVNGHTALSFKRSSKQHFLLSKEFNGMSSLSNITIMVACKWNGAATSGLFGQWTAGTSSQNAHFEIQSGGALRWRVANSDLKVNAAVTSGSWMTLAAITDCDRETPTISLVKDGQLLQSLDKSIGNQNFSAADLIYLGDSCEASDSSSGRYFDGLIAEVVILNRALTANERERLSKYFTDKYGADVRTNYHLSFKLGAEGETLTVTQPDGTVSDQVAFGAIPCDTSYGRFPSGGETFAWFAEPTPNADNSGPAYAAPLAPVQFSVERGLYEEPLSLTLSHPDPETTIFYTLDYSEPSPSNGMQYAGETIAINHTTVVRAVADKAGTLPCRSIQTHSYIFLSDVPNQTDIPAGCPSVWTSGGSTPASYGISTQIVATSEDVVALTNALRKLPILSLSLATDKVFGSSAGVYSHAADSSLEEAVSAEWLTNGVGFVQTDAGLKAQGAASRNFSSTPKKPLRLCFRGRYGAGKLKTPVLQDIGYSCDEFNTLILRAEYNNSWVHREAPQRLRGSNVRDQWMRDTQGQMSGYQSHGNHVHLFINGRYWGIYNVAERIDAALGATLFGGDKEEYDGLAYDGDTGTIKARDGDTTSWNALMTLISSDLTQRANYEAVAQRVDLPAFADYMLLNFFGGNQDWPQNNFAMVCSRLEGGKFYFCCWDVERTLEGVSDNRLSASFNIGPKKLHDRLLTSPEYKMLLADRAYKHLFNGGALTVESMIPRYRALADKLEPAMFAESARWGSYRLENGSASQSYGMDEWIAERDRVLNTYLPQRPAQFIAQLQSAGLYPSVEVPEISESANGSQKQVAISIPAGTHVYYTLDGNDPREAFSSGIAATASEYTQPFMIMTETVVKARALSGTTWSALAEYTVEVVQDHAVFILPDEGNWDKNGNWNTGTYPNGAGVWAEIPAPTTLDSEGKRNVRINKSAITIGRLDLINGSAINRVCNKKDATAGSTLTFDGGDAPALITVPNNESGMAVIEVNYGVILANELRLAVSNLQGNAEYGALRLQQAWSGSGGLTKEGPGVCSVTGGDKTYTGATRIREGVMTFSSKSIPTATSSFSVEPGGQLRLTSGNATYRFPCPLSIGAYGRDPALGNGLDSEGAVRFSSGDASVSTVGIETPVLLTGNAGIHVSGVGTSMTLAQGISGSGDLLKTGEGTLTLSGNINLGEYSATVAAGTLACAGTGSVSSVSGTGTVACLAGRVAITTFDSRLRFAARLANSGAANASGNGFFYLADPSVIPHEIDVYLSAADDLTGVYFGGLCVPLHSQLASRLATIQTHVFVPDVSGGQFFDGTTWTAVPAVIAAGAVEVTLNGTPCQVRMLTVTRNTASATPFSYAQWKETVFSPAQNQDEQISGPLVEIGKVPNLFRYAFGMTLEDSPTNFYPRLEISGTVRQYRWRINSMRDDLRYLVEASARVDNWDDAECLFDSDSQIPETDAGWVTLTDTLNLPQRFYRLQVFLK